MSKYPLNKLVPSFTSESLADALTTVADTSIDLAIDSGALDGVPVIGMLTGMMKVARSYRERQLVAKLVAFLEEVDKIPADERAEFQNSFSDSDDQEDFGGALLTLIDRADDLEKPRIIGRLLVAHAGGVFNRADLMRMSKMVDRCYIEDLAVLVSFRPGVQSQSAIAVQSLASEGFLHQAGIDGGRADGSGGGVIYDMSQYGVWLLEHGLNE